MVNITKVAPTTFLVFQQCVKIVVRDFAELLSNQICTWFKYIAKRQNYAISTNFSAFRALSSPVCCWWLWKEPVCWWWDEDADLETGRVTAVTIIGSHSHVSSQALGEVCHRLVDVFLWQLFPDDLQGHFQLISHPRLPLEFMVLSSIAPQLDATVQWQLGNCDLPLRRRRCSWCNQDTKQHQPLTDEWQYNRQARRRRSLHGTRRAGRRRNSSLCKQHHR